MCRSILFRFSAIQFSTFTDCPYPAPEKVSLALAESVCIQSHPNYPFMDYEAHHRIEIEALFKEDCTCAKIYYDTQLFEVLGEKDASGKCSGDKLLIYAGDVVNTFS